MGIRVNLTQFILNNVVNMNVVVLLDDKLSQCAFWYGNAPGLYTSAFENHHWKFAVLQQESFMSCEKL